MHRRCNGTHNGHHAFCRKMMQINAVSHNGEKERERESQRHAGIALCDHYVTFGKCCPLLAHSANNVWRMFRIDFERQLIELTGYSYQDSPTSEHAEIGEIAPDAIHYSLLQPDANQFFNAAAPFQNSLVSRDLLRSPMLSSSHSVSPSHRRRN